MSYIDRLAELRAENAELKARLDRLEQRMAGGAVTLRTSRVQCDHITGRPETIATEERQIFDHTRAVIE